MREKWRLALYLSMRVASSMKSLHLFLNSKQRTKLKTANRGGTLFTTTHSAHSYILRVPHVLLVPYVLHILYVPHILHTPHFLHVWNMWNMWRFQLCGREPNDIGMYVSPVPPRIQQRNLNHTEA